ncbi:MAG: epoxyqueuosine reductase QueH [Bacillota bacterium]|nr:epoxyqueuosine reductase QueH [Bacillota bacterium]
MEDIAKEKYINYYDKSLEILTTFDKEKKPTLLLHVCCGPCAGFPLTFVCQYFDVTILFNNSNIYPASEFKKRLDNLNILLAGLEKDYGFHINLVVPEYDYASFRKELEPYGDMPEGKQRCWICYRKRMEEAYQYAEERGFDYFTTVMTISREKNSQILNYIGSELERKHPKTKYFYSDFKKKDGFNKTVAIRKQYDLYYQMYCGCEYSLRDSLKWRAAKAKNSDLKQDNHVQDAQLND